ncbi:MAG: cell wall-active antibiotics response protein, partial [Candidatus Marinimicrobia bacterium]|nr:cell wall-active antibiotics response protein [Candidatus Neomarinimicrobiota bacterium]
ILITSTFIFAQSDDCDKCEVTKSYSFNTRQYKDLDVSISYGLGELTIGSSDEKDRIEGTITYDSSRITPKINMESVSSSGVLTIKTEKNKDKEHHIHKIKDFDNEMEFYFPPQIKTDLFLDFGVGDAEIDLTDISITKLNINCGLSDVELEINKRNNVICESVSIENGLGDLSVSGLGNLAAKDIDINIGLGSADIDLTGDRIYNTDINVDVGLGSLDMILPKKANIEIYVDSSFLSSVDIYGLKQKKNKYWVSPNWESSYPTITMDVNVGMGSVDIVIEE